MRCFAALDLPGEVRGAFAAAVPPLEGLRPVAEPSLHVTLAFLGAQDDAAAPALAAALRAAVAAAGAPAVPLSVLGAVWLPPRRPGVLAVELHGEGVAELQAAVVAGLSSWYEPETRPFLAHVTIARVRRGARIRPVEVALAPLPPFTAPSVTLYRSLLRPGGARYEAIERVALGPG